MKTIRVLATLAGLSLVLLTVGAIRARGQFEEPFQFAGKFTLPVEAQWGKLTLPAGEYTLDYGKLERDGPRLVFVEGTAKGSPYGMILAGPAGNTSRTTNTILCVREGSTLIVRLLDMPAIGESVAFPIPRGAKVVAHNGKRGGYTQLAEAPMLIQRIPVTRIAK
ncbi:MAG: hypothetical protein EPN47_00020 [Acidobacteria bacterium]|nr:MAG: hypothetical protein EPN47_00020 [Acidobacteriota bacterium]